MTPWRLAFAAILLATPAAAAQRGGCGVFAWPIAADIALLEAPQWSDSGALVPLSKPVGLRLKLGPLEEAGFERPPSRTPAPAGQNGSLRFEAKAGVLQITLSERAWTDVVQDGAVIEPEAFSGVLDCPGATKSIRYALKPGPALLQISNAPGRSIGVALTPPR